MQSHEAFSETWNSFLKELEAEEAKASNDKTFVVNLERKAALKELRQIINSNNANTELTKFTPELVKALSNFLSERWNLIAKTNLAYTYDQTGINQICIALADSLAIDQNKSRYQFLMPTIKYPYNTATDVNLFTDKPGPKLTEFIVSDDLEHYIDVYGALEHYANTGEFIQTYYDDKPIPLTQNEQNLIIHHSELTEKYYEISKKILDIKNQPGSLGLHLKMLSEGLREGGIRGEGGVHRAEREDNAAQSASEAIAAFSAFLETLDEDQKKKLFKYETMFLGERVTFGDIWNNITEAKKDLTNPKYCVDQISLSIDRILENNPTLYTTFTSGQSANLETNIIKNLENERKKVAEKIQNPDNTYVIKVAKINLPLNQLESLNDPAYVQSTWKKLNAEEKLSLFNTEHFTNTELILKLYGFLSPVGDLNVLISGINKTEKPAPAWRLLVQKMSNDEFAQFMDSQAINPFKKFAIVDLMAVLSPEKQQIILGDPHRLDAVCKNIRDNPRFPTFKLSQFIGQINDPELRIQVVEKIGYETLKTIFSNDRFEHEAKISLLHLFESLPAKAQLNFIEKFGADEINQIMVSPESSSLFTSDFKQAVQEAEKFRHYLIKGYDRADQAEKDNIKHSYNSVLKLMAAAYIGQRESGSLEYKHNWGSFFGGSTREAKVKAATILIKAIDGDPQALRQLNDHKKALKHGDLSTVYDLWVKTKETIYKEPLPTSEVKAVSRTIHD